MTAGAASAKSRAEADGKDLHAHAKGFGNNEMPPLMDQHHDAEYDGNGNDHYQEI